jgi:hypothetical protein
VSTDKEPADKANEAGATPDPVEVARRAEGRPPEERSSEDPTGQAEAILQESEDRVSDGAGKAETSGSN